MAHTLLASLRKPLACGFLNLFRVNHTGLASIYSQEVRYLYSKSALGLDGFEQQRQKVKLQMTNIVEKFKEKMAEYTKQDSKSMIFTEDLKNMIHLAENDQDIALAIEMLVRYNKQNKSLRFGNFIFGPVIMRMLYIYNKPDLAIECFKNKELDGIFDQQVSYQLILDLLLENKRYKEVLEITDLIKDKQLEGHMYPRHVVVLAMAACYKLNNQEALDYALKLWTNLNETGHQPMRRATTFCAALALNLNRPDLVLEILTASRNQNYITVRNLKVAALSELGRVDDVMPILKGVLNDDTPHSITGDESRVHTFNKDVFEKVKQAVAKSNDPEISLEFNRLEQMFKQHGHLTDLTLDEQLCSEIIRPPVRNEFDQRENFQFRSPRNFNQNYQRSGQNTNYRRPGLSDLV